MAPARAAHGMSIMRGSTPTTQVKEKKKEKEIISTEMSRSSNWLARIGSKEGEKRGRREEKSQHHHRRRVHLGSILSAGGGGPFEKATPSDWIYMIDRFQNAALESRLGIPLLYGTDAVHGNNNVYGATVFPHNIGLGATRIGVATALEVRARGAQFTFAPYVAHVERMDYKRYVTPKDIVEGSANLNLAFVAQIFQQRNGLSMDTKNMSFAEMMIDDAQTSREERCFRLWINSLGVDSYVNNIWVILEILDKVYLGSVNWKQATKPPIKMPFRKVENCNQAIRIGKELNFSLVNVAGNDIDIIEEPCVAADGYTYDRKAIQTWLEENDKSPMTNLPLPTRNLIPNYTLLSAISEWKSRKQ
ncbi:hypothetical protein TEA_010051 [Camellia sinensis var. sinensis]|uniref:U-box domain-containing protein n=1 Tax=Camellia sinensis var. sinensis TaxID=542762 RepID=A0A4S4DU80_CAMSN|nr:hypothetical protein TEA_010051 [Camellia sinensis var. sinensis]